LVFILFKLKDRGAADYKLSKIKNLKGN